MLDQILDNIWLIIGVIVVGVVFLSAVGSVFKWIRKVAPNKALILYGWRTKSTVTVLKKVEKPQVAGQPKEYETQEEEAQVNFKILRSGMAYVIPILHEVQVLDLNVRTLDLKVENVLSNEAVPLTVDAIAQVQIGGDETHVATAAEKLLGKTQQEIDKLSSETLMGHLRAIIGTLTVAEVIKDREAFSRSVQEVAFHDMAGLGFQINSFVMKDISDGKGYLESLGTPEIESKKSAARVAKATADQKASMAEQDSARNIAEYTRDTDLKKAGFATEVNKAQAIADMSGDIEKANQDIELEGKKTLAAERAADRKDKEYDADIRRKADADRYAAEETAKGTLATGQAGAEVDKLKLVARAEGEQKLVDVYNNYGPEALQIVLAGKFIETLPETVGAVTSHLASVDSISIVDLGGNGSGGASPVRTFANEGMGVVAQLVKAFPALIGDDLAAILNAFIVKQAKKLDADLPSKKTKEEETPAPSTPAPTSTEPAATKPAEESVPEKPKTEAPASQQSAEKKQQRPPRRPNQGQS